MLVSNIHQFNDMTILVGRILFVGEGEVEHTNRIHILQTVVPLALGSLLADRSGGIVEAAVLEIALLCLLHLHDELLTLLCLTVNIEY